MYNRLVLFHLVLFHLAWSRITIIVLLCLLGVSEGRARQITALEGQVLIIGVVLGVLLLIAIIIIGILILVIVFKTQGRLP